MKAIAVPTLEQAIELVHTGKIHDFNFEINGWNAKLNGFEYVVNGTTYNVPELRKISPDTNREGWKHILPNNMWLIWRDKRQLLT